MFLPARVGFTLYDSPVIDVSSCCRSIIGRFEGQSSIGLTILPCFYRVSQMLSELHRVLCFRKIGPDAESGMLPRRAREVRDFFPVLNCKKSMKRTTSANPSGGKSLSFKMTAYLVIVCSSIASPP